MSAMIPVTIGKKIEDYYKSQGDKIKLEKQEQSNESQSKLHPTATLPYDVSGKKYRIEFFQTYKNKILSAKVKELFDEKVAQEKKKKIEEIADIEEKNIFHAGYFSSTSVKDMKEEEKSSFVSRISSMKVRTLDIEKKIIHIW